MDYVIAVLPSIGVGLLFFFALRAILSADRRERIAASKWEMAQDRTEEQNRTQDDNGARPH